MRYCYPLNCFKIFLKKIKKIVQNTVSIKNINALTVNYFAGYSIILHLDETAT